MAEKKLNARQKKTMQKHSKHHTAKHMKEMTRLMLRSKNPLTFSQAHKVTMKKVGA
tara:strand:- start:208 stop:375 length:168 start_codon:yes stop_codon:yes gene_type:complete